MMRLELALLGMVLIGTSSAFAQSEVMITTGTVPLSIAGCERTDECYIPSVVTVDVGDKIVMMNEDEFGLHTYTSGTGTDSDGVFDSGILSVSGTSSYEWVAEEAGEYPYFCILHPWMTGVIIVRGEEQEEEPAEAPADGGGCLIATAAYGTELAPQVQQLRELRESIVMSTESGAAFMSGFNDFYYSFSPVIADLERENPAFRDLVRISITPLVSSLSILNHVDIDTEFEMIGYGVSLIILNLAMYAGVPVFGIVKLRRYRRG